MFPPLPVRLPEDVRLETRREVLGEVGAEVAGGRRRRPTRHYPVALKIMSDGLTLQRLIRPRLTGHAWPFVHEINRENYPQAFAIERKLAYGRVKLEKLEHYLRTALSDRRNFVSHSVPKTKTCPSIERRSARPVRLPASRIGEAT